MSTFRDAHNAWIAVRDENEPVCLNCEEILDRRGIVECETSASEADPDHAWCTDCCPELVNDCMECIAAVAAEMPGAA